MAFFNCTWEINGELGYREFVKNQYDIVILDVMMPIKDGFSTAKDIRGIDKKVPIIFCKTPLLKKHWRRSQKSQLWSLTNVINYQDSHRILHRANFTCVTKETRTHFSDVFMSFFLTWPLFMRLWWCSSSTGGVNASFHSWIILFICQSALHLGWGCRKKCKWGNSKSIRLSRLFLLAYLVWWCRRKTVGRRGTYFNQDFEKMIG